jgi:hypothetical protein
MSFVIKALGELQVHCVVVGIWPDDNLLTFYNGELNGRIDDIHLECSGDDLRRVIERGSNALNIVLAEPIRARLISSAYGSVGLLQQLLEALCREAGILRTAFARRELNDRSTLDGAIAKVWDSNRPRFAQFVAAFGAPGGASGADEAAAGTRAALLRALVEDFDDDELIAGIPKDELLRRVRPYRNETMPEDIDTCLDSLHTHQGSIRVSPLILAYEPNAGRLFLADRRFLFYRHAGRPSWPWRA